MRVYVFKYHRSYGVKLKPKIYNYDISTARKIKITTININAKTANGKRTRTVVIPCRSLDPNISYKKLFKIVMNQKLE